MSDTISNEDRKLIEEAIAAGKLQKVQMGALGIPIEMTYRESHGLVMSSAAFRHRDKNKVRREKIIRMLNNGVDVKIICRSMKINMDNMKKLINNNRSQISTVVGLDT